MKAKVLHYKKILILLWKSEYKVADFLSVVWSIVFLPRNLLLSNSIIYKRYGRIECNEFLNFGIASNKIGLDYNAKGTLRVGKKALLKTGYNVRIARGGKVFVNGRLEIGDNTYIQPNCNILANQSVSIGSDCAISWNCSILDDDMHTIVIGGLEKNKAAPITIGNHVWIGNNVTILKGVNIGDGSVIASGSVVTRSVGSGCLAGGVPARIIKENVSWK